MKPVKDLREWLDILKADNDLWVIKKEVDPEPDIGAIGKAVSDVQGPAALIEHVKGYKSPVAIGVHAAIRRVAKALHLPPNASNDDIIKGWHDAYSRYPVKSRKVSDGSCKENIVKGEDKVNLFNFPLHRINTMDGSFYLSKACVITRNPETDVINVGIYRHMVLGKNKMGVYLAFDQHASRAYMMQEEKGKPLDVAIALGNEPILPMVAGAKIPYEWTEFDLVGAVRNSPYELTQAETTDLPVPANAEIIIEGQYMPIYRVFEGTFGEYPGAYTGYFFSPVFKVKAITHRNNPIFESLYIGRPYAENHYMTPHSKLAALTYEVQKIMPKITRISYLKPYNQMVVIQGRWVHTGDPKQAINLVWGSSLGRTAKLTVAVDEDINPWDPADVLWAMTVRVSSANDILVMPDAYQSLDPAQISGVGVKIGVDATKPRGPRLRYNTVDWVESPPGTQKWKDEILRMGGQTRREGDFN